MKFSIRVKSIIVINFSDEDLLIEDELILRSLQPQIPPDNFRGCRCGTDFGALEAINSKAL